MLPSVNTMASVAALITSLPYLSVSAGPSNGATTRYEPLRSAAQLLAAGLSSRSAGSEATPLVVAEPVAVVIEVAAIVAVSAGNVVPAAASVLDRLASAVV